MCGFAVMLGVQRQTLCWVLAVGAVTGASSPWVATELNFLGYDTRVERRAEDLSNCFVAHEWTSLTRTTIVGWRIARPLGLKMEDIRKRCGGAIPAAAGDLLGSRGVVRAEASGWPLAGAARCSIVNDDHDGPVSSTEWKPPRPPWRWLNARLPEVIPLRILWAGMLGNIAGAMCVCGGVYIAWVYMRARRRLRRGECIGCRYEVRGIPVCPECGTEQPRVSQAAECIYTGLG